MGRRVGEAGCFPLSDNDNVVMVSSKKHPDQLVFPKGGVHEGEDQLAAAQRETEEEAGVAGTVQGDLGLINGCHWYVLKVDKFYGRWPEMHQRQRYLIPISEALQRTDIRPKARDVLLAFLHLGEL